MQTTECWPQVRSISSNDCQVMSPSSGNSLLSTHRHTSLTIFPHCPPTPFSLPLRSFLVQPIGFFFLCLGIKNSMKSKLEEMKIVNNLRCFPSRKVYDLTGLKRFVNQIWNLKRDQQRKETVP